MKRAFLGVFAILVLSVVLLVVQAQRHVVTSYSVVINAPVEKVWDFLSDNRNAKGWSVIFDHISPMASSPVPEGQIGALRRCFRNVNEQGFFWDERTLSSEPYIERTLRTYNVSNTSWDLFEKFQFTAYQKYEDLGNGQTRLTFEGDLDDYTKYNTFERFIFWVSQHEGERVFRLNLENIKAMLEQGENYQRPHPWEEQSPFDA
ncbi:MAG: SRPBCC family protein [Saccharospirillaceae bacterium]|nr:SRPBCC family protein [Saccharospirillaceae bacterium]